MPFAAPAQTPAPPGTGAAATTRVAQQSNTALRAATGTSHDRLGTELQHNSPLGPTSGEWPQKRSTEEQEEPCCCLGHAPMGAAAMTMRRERGEAADSPPTHVTARLPT